MIQTCALLGMLGICSIEDIRKKQVQVYLVLVFGIIGMIFHLLYRSLSIGNIFCGMMLGVILMVVSKITSGSVGMGDGLILMVTGVYLGIGSNVKLFFHGLLFAAIWSLVLIVLFRKTRRQEIPFVPFLLMAYVEMLLL